MSRERRFNACNLPIVKASFSFECKPAFYIPTFLFSYSHHPFIGCFRNCEVTFGHSTCFCSSIQRSDMASRILTCSQSKVQSYLTPSENDRLAPFTTLTLMVISIMFKRMDAELQEETMKLMSLACFSLLLLLLLLLIQSFSTTTHNDYAKFQNFETGSVSKPNPIQAKQGSRENSGEGSGGEAVLGDEKRKIYTGPNPLHNR
ncbi:hypothetical protein VNO77_42781 [Canavalia gladiata]|uniref:Uncharacterized protein n=1 Tax=Canavalia gladiata TaxID=3824 RepID=A0AAN9JVC2_CANGL